MGYSAQDWARDPIGVFKALSQVATRTTSKFNERQRAMPLLEKKALALRVYAQELKSAQLHAEVSARMSEIAGIRSDMERAKYLMSEALQKLVTIRSVLARLPGGGGLGADPRLEVAKYALIATSVLAVSVMVDRIVAKFDATGAAMEKSLNRLAKLHNEGKISDAQYARARARVVEAGGIDTPGGLPNAAGLFSGSIAVIAIAALVFMSKRKALA